jgi:hypothetical protein
MNTPASVRTGRRCPSALMCKAITVEKAMPWMSAIFVRLSVHAADGHGRHAHDVHRRDAHSLDFGRVHVIVHFLRNITTETSAHPTPCPHRPELPDARARDHYEGR